MKKTKVTLGIVAGLLTVAALTACDPADPVYSPEGYILTYKVGDQTFHYTADQLFGSYYKDSDKTQAMFDSIYKLIVRNYFTLENPDGEGTGKSQYKTIEDLAKRNVEADKQTANKNADTNGTKYDVEFNSILASHGCKDEAELLEYYIYEGELDKFQDNFYDKNISLLRDGKENEYDGWIKKMAPYHISHLLVKIDDSGSTNYWNGTIGEEDAERLNLVANELAKAEDSFGYTANLYSEDVESGKAYGDLGIMDKSTSFVDEFKLGIYAYENIYGEHIVEAMHSEIGISDEIYYDYKDVTEETPNEMPTIPFGIFETLNNYKKVVKAEKTVSSGKKIEVSVNDDDPNYYPRNVFFNHYLNKHAVAFITPDVVEGQDAAKAAEYAALPAFKEVNGKKVLCARVKLADGTDDWKPILVARAGADSYQGIHFIIMNRTPFETTDKNGVALKDYYTTKFPGQAEYPTDDSGKDLQTYVNFNNLEDKKAKERAESVESSIKSFDSDLNKFIYKKYKAAGKLTINDPQLDQTIDRWIEVTANTKKFNDNLSWEKTWNAYIEKLQQQNNERKYMVKLTCAIGYANADATGYDALYNELGGECNNGKKH